MTESKKAPLGRGSREWEPYPETNAPPEGQRAEARDMEMIESLAVLSAIHFFACRARLKPSEQDVLNAVLHNTIRYGRTEFKASHRFLAKYTGYAPKTHGAPLKGLHEKGFITYRQGSPKKSATGHRHTQSLIRVRIPEGWEAFKDNAWVERFASDEGSGDSSPFEGRPPSESKAPGEGDRPGEGLESRDLRVVEGLESRDPAASTDPKVSNLVTRRSRNSRPYGLESRDLEGLESRGPEGLESRGTKRGDLKRGDSERGDLSGETQPDPPLAEQTLGAADAAQGSAASKSKSQHPSSSRPEGPKAPDRGAHLSLVEAYSPEEGGETSARAALASLERHITQDGRKRLTVERKDEIITGCARLLEKDPEVEEEDLHYLLGLWAGDRALENANYLYSHMRRNKRHLGQLAHDMEARGRGTDPEEWLKVGIIHGQQKREARQAEREDEGDTPANEETRVAASRQD